MMKFRYVFAVLAVAVVFGSQAHAGLCGKLDMSDTKIEVRDNIDLSYEPGMLLERNNGPLYAFVYVFNERETYPQAMSFELKKKGSKWKGSIEKLPEGTVFGLVKIGDGRLFDCNNDFMWDFSIKSGGKAVRGAYMREALSYLGNIVPTLHRNTDLDKAKHCLRLEVQNYPDNVQAKVGLASTLFETNEIDKAEFTKRVEELVLQGYDKNKENEVRAVSRALRAIGRPADGDDLENAYIMSHPTCDLAEEVLRSNAYKSQTREEFEANITNYVKKFKLTMYSDRMYIDLINSYLQKGDGDQAIRVVRSYPLEPGVDNNPPPAILNMLAVSLMRQDSLIPMARQYAERAIRSAEKHKSDPCPRFMAKEEFDFSNREIEGIAHDTYGYILRSMQKPAEAAVEFQKSHELLRDASSAEMMEHLSEALASSNQTPAAVEVMREAIRTARSLPQTDQRFVLIASPDQNKNKEELNALRQEAKEAKQLALRLGMMNYDIQSLVFSRQDGRRVRINDFNLTTLEGKKVKLEDLKGKVVVMDFWATWCGPCRMSMPYMQKVYEKYKDNSKVQIVMVNVWERTSDSTDAQRIESRKKIVNDFLAKNKDYSFPMMLDGNDAIVSLFGVTGIPTKFYLDKDGKVQFKEVGFPGADVFVEEASEKINALLE